MKKILVFAGCFLYALIALADLEIYRVVPSKIIYRLNEAGTVKVTVANTGKAQEACDLKVTMVSDIDTKTLIKSESVTLPAGQEKTYQFSFDTGRERYGRAILAELVKDGKVIAKRSEFFNVINEWWRVAVLGSALSRDKRERQKVFDYYHIPYQEFKHSFYPGDYLNKACGPFLGYGSHSMLFASMPSLFGEHTPDVPEDTDWYSGRGWYLFNTRKLKNTVATCKSWGFKNSIFSIAAMTGPAGFELARRDPTLVARTETGAFADAGYASPDPMELSHGITSRCAHWYGIKPDLYDKKVVEFGAEELAKGVTFFGWDGVFFDGCGYVVKSWFNYHGIKLPGKLDPTKVSARNIRLTREILRKSKPDLFIWYNGANPDRVDTAGEGFGSGGGRAGKLEMISDANSGNLKEFQSTQIANPRNAGHSWRSLFEVYLGERDVQRLKDWGRPVSDITITGSLHPEGFVNDMPKELYEKTRSQWAWSNHAMSLIASAQLHFFGGGGGFRPMLQLMTRFSKFFWDEDIEILKKSYKQFSIDSLREVWWEDAVYQRPTPEYTDYIINLVNTAENECAIKTITNCPPAADDVEIACLNWDSADKLEAWAIKPYDYGAKQKEPEVYRLIPKVVEGEVTYELPPFKYYSLVVIRKHK